MKKVLIILSLIIGLTSWQSITAQEKSAGFKGGNLLKKEIRVEKKIKLDKKVKKEKKECCKEKECDGKCKEECLKKCDKKGTKREVSDTKEKVQINEEIKKEEK